VDVQPSLNLDHPADPMAPVRPEPGEALEPREELEDLIGRPMTALLLYALSGGGYRGRRTRSSP